MVKNEPKASLGSDEEMASNDFDFRSEDELYIICNMILGLPLEYDTTTKATEEEDGMAEEMAAYKPLCYYVMHGELVNEDMPSSKGLTCLCNNI